MPFSVDFPIPPFVKPRCGHVAVYYKERVILWGGYYNDPTTNRESYINCDQLDIYNPYTGEWKTKRLTGTLPSNNCCSVGCVLNGCLYVFGGEVNNCTSSKLYAIDLKTFLVKLLSTSGDIPSPRNKLCCWREGNKMYVFGGYCNMRDYVHENGPYKIVKDTFSYRVDLFENLSSCYGWSNELYQFDTVRNEWSLVHTDIKDLPVPRAAHSCVKIGKKVYIFGGRFQERRRNDLFCLDMQSLTWKTLKPDTQDCENEPVGRSWHTLSPINRDKLLLYGGLGSSGELLENDAWIIDFSDTILKFRNLRPSLEQSGLTTEEKNRLWHGATHTSNIGEVHISGGYADTIFRSRPPLSRNVLTFRDRPLPLYKLCLIKIMRQLKFYEPVIKSRGDGELMDLIRGI
ncbi:Kelch domain-containing protein 2 [Trichoplax sp. H2]|nr:Kelch domain-containing protein 2 [Trichoplax sp. H2]|eukprot:RDD47007.1 Kelch domain-containing protein 2 [Trichoplax sp. H2]